MRATCLLMLCLSVPPASHGATWQFAAGPSRSDGNALEISRSSGDWEAAVGYVSNQRAKVRVVQDTCIAGASGPECSTQSWTTRQSVRPYGYLSLQRKYPFRPDAELRPILGFGIVANSHTNPYVSSPVTFSLSAALHLGPRWALEWRHFSNAGTEQPNLGQDLLLLRASFGSGSR